MDKLLDTLTGYLQAAAKATMAVAPKVWDATLLLVRVDGLVTLALFVIVLSAIIFAWSFFQRMVNKSTLPDSRNSGPDKEDLTAIVRIFGSLLSVAWLIAFCLNALLMFLAIFSPQLYIMYQLAHKAGIL